jgi:hypothetical protein
MLDQRKSEYRVLGFYTIAGLISLFVFLKAVVFRNELCNPLLEYLAAGSVFAFSVARLFTIVLHRGRS